MRHLEAIVGEGRFRDGLRAYLGAHAFENATWTDLITVLDELTREDLVEWSRAWVEERGRPIVTTELTIADGRIGSLAFSTADPYPNRGLTWTEDMLVVLGYADRQEIVPVRLRDRRTAVDAARGRPAPLFVLPNGGGFAYGDFRLDAASRAWLVQHLPEITDPLTRGSAWVTLWDALLNGEIASPQVIDLALASLARESDELNVQRVLSYLEQAYWKFTDADTRQARAPAIEDALKAGLDRAAGSSLKAAYFATLRDIALTSARVAWLRRVWNGSETIPGLTLAEPDFIGLAKELALREVPDWRTILEQQIAKTENPDRKARLQFVAPALSADRGERDRWFAALGNIANRRRESWVLEGLGALNHPLRAAAAESYIRPSLERLEEIQQTGDIFFPTRWMNSALSGHRSANAARIVRTFLDNAPPSYPERLRRIILVAADDLFRASGTPGAPTRSTQPQ
jgi:aminopeptidase N